MLAPHLTDLERAAPVPALAPATVAIPRRGNGPLEGSTAERLHVVVAAVHGRFRPLVSHGRVLAGTLLGHITGGGHSEEVRAPVDIDVQGLLARPGHLVAPGQALVWAQQIETAA